MMVLHIGSLHAIIKEIKHDLHKKEIEQINERKTDGNRLRSKARDMNTKFDGSFYKSLEKKNYQACHITKLEKDNGTEINEPKDILEEIKCFYHTLYTDIHTENISNNDNIFLNNHIPQLDETDKDYCEQSITIDECSKALKKMKNGKTPGTDGLTVEFYKMFWKDIKDLVFESFGFAYDIGELSIDQKRGIIKLLPKKDKILKFL